MNPSIASLIYGFGIVALFWLGRDKTLRTSVGLWIPVIYLWLIGSRSPSIWLGITPPVGTDVQMDGTPLDRVIFATLLLVGVIVLAYRGTKVIHILRANWALVGYFAFCLLSVVWSDFPDVAAKRWIKAIGDVVMALIIVTDHDPIGAFKRVITRVGFLLVPASLLLIKYYPFIGRTYDPYIGTQFFTGVTTNKNTLGVVLLIVCLGALWGTMELLRSKEYPNRKRLLVAWVVLLAMGLKLLLQADSATSRGCFGLGALLLILATLPSLRRHPGIVHAMVLIIVLTGGFATVFGATAGIAHAMGRNGDLTGRTEIWSVLIPMTPSPLLGAGFESFWLGERVRQARAAFVGNPLNEAHNGYIEVYLNVGWIGLSFLALFLITGYRRVAEAFRRNPVFGNLLLAYVVSTVIYCITEAGFRMLDPIWVVLLAAITASSAVASPVRDVSKEPLTKAVHPSITGHRALGFHPRRDSVGKISL